MSRIGLWGITKGRGGAVVLDGVNLAVAAGELVVITGPRGAGQSTLLAVVATALAPDAGELELEGRSVVSLQSTSLPYVRRNIGYLPATPPLIADETVLENVMLPLAARAQSPEEAEGAARVMLDELGISALADRRADGLSSPERRLTGIARALVGTPPVVVLDDPGAGLDDRDRARLVVVLHQARAEGAAILCGTSDGAFAHALTETGGRRLRLEAGRLVGTTGRPLRLVDPEAGLALTASGGSAADGGSGRGAAVVALVGGGAREAS